jgi:hypothetical protein
LKAEKRIGRFGPEYFVTEEALADAGLQLAPAASDSAMVRRTRAERLPASVEDRLAQRALRESVPISLYQELQMKHEQLLVQYGMVRAAGTRMLELRAELESKQRALDESRTRAEGLKRRLEEETARLEGRLREAELEREGRGLEIAALKEKVRGLEMFTRNARTSASVEQQYREIMEQARRVERVAAPRSGTKRRLPRQTGPPAEQDH